MTLNFWPSCVYLPHAEITCVCHHSRCQVLNPSLHACKAGKHSTSGARFQDLLVHLVSFLLSLLKDDSSWHTLDTRPLSGSWLANVSPFWWLSLVCFFSPWCLKNKSFLNILLMTSNVSIVKEANLIVEEIKDSHYWAELLSRLWMLSMFLWVPSPRLLLVASNYFLLSALEE